jgi:quinol monooxygenase YgiN
MMQALIRYKVKPDQVERNLELLRAFFEELESVRPDGVRDAVFQLEDGVTFIHIVETDNNPRRFSQLETFRAYRATLDQRCDEPPVMTELRQIGSYGPPGSV